MPKWLEPQLSVLADDLQGMVGIRTDSSPFRSYGARDRRPLPRVAYPLAGADRNWPRRATPGPIAFPDLTSVTMALALAQLDESNRYEAALGGLRDVAPRRDGAEP
jgi:hypothetical protein